VVAVLFAIAAIVAGMVMFKPPDRTGTLRPADVKVGPAAIGSKQVPLDLSANLPVVVANPRYAATADKFTLSLSLAGVTIRDMSTPLVKGRGTLDTKVAKYVAAGSLKGRAEISAKGKTLAFVEFPAKATQKWYSTVEGIVAILVILAGFAYLEGALRPLRAGRRRISAFVGATVGTPITAVGVAALFAALGHADPDVGGLVVVAILSALAGLALALAAYRRGRRLSMRRAVRKAVMQPPKDPAQSVDYAS
jgi:multisubunit Na+/H+ antiporter MnhG subunit